MHPILSRGRVVVGVLLIVGIALSRFPHPSCAATFDSMAVSTISSPVLVGGGSASYDFDVTTLEFIDTMSSTTGSGVATIVTATNLTDDTGVGTNTAHVTGSATAIPGMSSFASAGVEIHDFVTLVNQVDSTDAELTFDFDYSALSSITAGTDEGAAASFNIHITGIGDEPGESLEIDFDGPGPDPFMPAVGQEFEINSFQSTLLGDSGTSASGMVSVRYTGASLTNGGDGFYQFSIFTRASGVAVAPVPEPASLALWILLGTIVAAFSFHATRQRLRKL